MSLSISFSVSCWSFEVRICNKISLESFCLYVKFNKDNGNCSKASKISLTVNYQFKQSSVTNTSDVSVLRINTFKIAEKN